MISYLLLSSPHAAKEERVESFLGGACPAFLNLQRIIADVMRPQRRKTNCVEGTSKSNWHEAICIHPLFTSHWLLYKGRSM